jgi:hypothetical protein
MDILTAAEIASINRASVLVQKYVQSIDRESAYEILSRKISDGQNVSAEAAANNGRVTQGDSGSGSSSRSSAGRNSNSLEKDVVKVLTSATFIRGVFGILKKVM